MFSFILAFASSIRNKQTDVQAVMARHLMTVEISLPRPHPPRPQDTLSHIHTGPLVITTGTLNLWLKSAVRLMNLRVYERRDIC
jgi:hypothetical protein